MNGRRISRRCWKVHEKQGEATIFNRDSRTEVREIGEGLSDTSRMFACWTGTQLDRGRLAAAVREAQVNGLHYRG